MMNSTTLRPGLLVSLKTHLTGNVQYQKTVLEAAKKDEQGREIATWETQRVVADPDELERGKVARGKAGTLVRSVCAHSAFGLLCPESDAEELEKVIAEARKVADEFNATAQLSRLTVYVLTGRIAPDDVEAVKAINSEIRELMQDMAEGIQSTDVKVIREAANKAKQLGAMLTPNAEARVQIAIETARKAAKQIVKSGEAAAIEVDRMAIRKITDMRTSFLDLGEDVEIAKPAEQGRAVDFDTEEYGPKIFSDGGGARS